MTVGRREFDGAGWIGAVRLARRPDAIGRGIVLDGRPMTVVGVMGADATFPAGAEAWVPLWPYVRDVLPPDALLHLRNVGFLFLVGRAARAHRGDQRRRTHARPRG